MVFSSPTFLFFFLPATLAAYHAVPRRARNLVLLVASIAFYTYDSGALVLLLLVSTVTDYVAGRIVARGRITGSVSLTRTGVLVSVLVNVGLLSYFKYANFFVEQLNSVGHGFGWGEIAWTSVILPIGISFYTFQSMSYTIDIAKGRVGPIGNLLDFALYVALFPQLIAGPIVRFHEISEEIKKRRQRLDDFAEGVVRFAHGLAKKVIVADAAGHLVEAVFTLPANELTTAAAWLGVAAYTIQIYFDFSGYSDMAIGLGRMFGFHFPENFRRPYSALSITDFWRRWHITLSNWFRDYVYIPLGGSRGTTARTYGNLVTVFFLTGLWHGASWTFVIWGAYHGVLLVIERVSGQRPVGDDSPNSWLRRAATLLAVMVGWVLFRSESLAQAGSILGAMFSYTAGPLPAQVATVLTTRVQITMVLASLVVLLPRDFVGGPVIPEARGPWAAAARTGLMLFALPYAFALVTIGTFSPFLYYQF
jgi:alginate O-acetyltransferase complex protein AlgI